MDNINNQSMIRVILDSFHKNGAYCAKTEIKILESQLARRRLAQRQEQYQEVLICIRSRRLLLFPDAVISSCSLDL